MKLLIGLTVAVLATTSLLAAPATAPLDFTLSTPSKIPGATLDPGSYTIRVVNQLSDRVILRVDGKNNPFHSIFIGIPNKEIKRPAAAGPVRWSAPSSDPGYLKGWYFPGTPSVVEFVYPKADALTIASSNPSKVPAVDPASEGKVTDNTLSQDDMQLLTLWLLSVEQVQSGNQAPAVKAERYQIASFTPQKPLIQALPHTASQLPLIWLLGLCSILAALSLRIRQWRRHSVSLLRPASAGGGHVETQAL
jgi:hypothetical protein